MPPAPRRGEVWWVNLDPTVGSEIQKTRPAVVLSSDAFAGAPVRLVVPVTTWQDRFTNRPNLVRLDASKQNGLNNASAGDVLQLRCLSLERFSQRLGRLEADLLEELAAAAVVVIDYYPE